MTNEHETERVGEAVLARIASLDPREYVEGMPQPEPLTQSLELRAELAALRAVADWARKAARSGGFPELTSALDALPPTTTAPAPPPAGLVVPPEQLAVLRDLVARGDDVEMAGALKALLRGTTGE